MPTNPVVDRGIPEPPGGSLMNLDVARVEMQEDGTRLDRFVRCRSVGEDCEGRGREKLGWNSSGDWQPGVPGQLFHRGGISKSCDDLGSARVLEEILDVIQDDVLSTSTKTLIEECGRS